MRLGDFPTRFEGRSRGFAIAVPAMLFALLAIFAWPNDTAPGPKLRASPTQHSDAQLYRDITGGVAAGGDYYEVAAKEQRAAGYPLKPFYTFRLPTLATVYAALGEQAMIVIGWALCAGLMLAWWFRLKPLLSLPLLGTAMFLMAGGIAGFLQPVTGLFHESWAALFLAIMIAVWRPDRLWPAFLAGAAALMIRELALPMILAMGGLALVEKRWREAMGWAAIVAIFALYLAVHAHWVSQVVLPADQPSQGWSQMLGGAFALKSIAKVTMGTAMPYPLLYALLILSLFGWASVKSEWALRGFLLLLGYGLMLALFARADTFYWALIAAPLSFVGLAFLPKAFTDLAKAMARTPYPEP
jgi:hypothetical protein